MYVNINTIAVILVFQHISRILDKSLLLRQTNCLRGLLTGRAELNDESMSGSPKLKTSRECAISQYKDSIVARSCQPEYPPSAPVFPNPPVPSTVLSYLPAIAHALPVSSETTGAWCLCQLPSLLSDISVRSL